MRILGALILIFLTFPGMGQEKYHLEVIPTDAKTRISYQKSFASIPERENEITDIINYLQGKSFLSARWDSTGGDSLNMIAYINRGPAYTLQLLPSIADSVDLNGFKGILSKFNRPVRFTQSKQTELYEEPVIWLENHGYPFAKVSLSEVVVEEGKINARLKINPGPFIVIDSLARKGNIKISRNYIYRYTGIRPGQAYNESDIRKIHKRLKELPFATVGKPPEIAFWKDKAKVYLYLNKKKASSFSGILGVLPNSRVPGKVMINGDLKLKLLNAFAQGELISLNWRSLEKGTQDLAMKLNYPYLLSTPLGLDYEFSLYKKDTSYLTLHHNIGIRYLFGGNNYLQFFTEIFSSNIIEAAGLETVSVLPEFADVRKNLGGIEYNFENPDYRLNPRKGILVNLNAAGGIKTLKKNEAINPVLYDSLDLRSGQFQAKLKFSGFIPIFRQQTLLAGISGARMWNKLLFENELYRIGGMSSLRGFDEESLHASFYTILLLEYRYLFDQNSFLAVFWNGAYLEKRTQQETHSDLPYGLGAGISFDTKVGIFSLYYALGAQEHGSLSFKQSKIHFGISTSF